MNIASFSSEALAAPGTPGTVPASPCTRFNSRAADRATVSNAAAGGSSLSFFLLFGEKKIYLYGEREGGSYSMFWSNKTAGWKWGAEKSLPHP